MNDVPERIDDALRVFRQNHQRRGTDVRRLTWSNGILALAAVGPCAGCSRLRGELEEELVPSLVSSGIPVRRLVLEAFPRNYTVVLQEGWAHEPGHACPRVS